MSEEFRYYVKEGRSIIIGRAVRGPGYEVKNPDLIKRFKEFLEKKRIDEKPSFDSSIPEDQQVKKIKKIEKIPIQELKDKQKKTDPKKDEKIEKEKQPEKTTNKLNEGVKKK